MLAHVDMDAFFAAVEVLDQPWLRGRPVIVGGGRRGVVAAASYEARRSGVRSAMPVFEARRRCPEGVFLPPRGERYRQVSHLVMEVLGSFTPLLEPVSVDEAFLDLHGTEGLWGGPREAGRAIKSKIRAATGLTCSVGIAPVRFLAKVASDRDKPDGLTVVEDLEAFLATVQLKEVPGVGRRAQERLLAMGCRRLVELRALGPERLGLAFGAFGERLWDLARGRDADRLSPGEEVKSLSHERTLPEDTANREVLLGHLLRLCQKTCRRLRAHGLRGRVVVLKLKHADFRLATRRATLSAPSDQAEPIFAAARGLLLAYPSPGPFRLIGVGISGLSPRERGEGELFGAEIGRRRQALAAAEDELCRRYGEKALSRAGALKAFDPVPGSSDSRPQGPPGRRD